MNGVYIVDYCFTCSFSAIEVPKLVQCWVGIIFHNFNSSGVYNFWKGTSKRIKESWRACHWEFVKRCEHDTEKNNLFTCLEFPFLNEFWFHHCPPGGRKTKGQQGREAFWKLPFPRRFKIKDERFQAVLVLARIDRKELVTNTISLHNRAVMQASPQRHQVVKLTEAWQLGHWSIRCWHLLTMWRQHRVVSGYVTRKAQTHRLVNVFLPLRPECKTIIHRQESETESSQDWLWTCLVQCYVLPSLKRT